jgi:hypothetical protein
MPRQRITLLQLAAAVKLLNRITGSPEVPYKKEGDRHAPNVGNYHLSRAYGGFALHQMANDNGGIRDVLNSGHVPARQLFDMMSAYRYGMESATR